MNSRKNTVSLLLIATIMVAGKRLVTISKSFAEPGTNIQKIKCDNNKVNIKGVDGNKRQTARLEEDEAANAIREDGQIGQRNGLFDGLNIDKYLVNICVNFHYNE